MSRRIAFRSLVMLACMLFQLACAQGTTPAWVPADLAAKLNQAAATSYDNQIVTDITYYQNAIAGLDTSNATVAARTFLLKEKVLIMYKEYNRSKTRYVANDFSFNSAYGTLKSDMNRMLTRLQAGQDPAAGIAGMLLARATWIDSFYFNNTTEKYEPVIVKYDLIIPNGYNPSTPAPLMVSHKDSPSETLVKQTPYVLIRNYQVPDEFKLVRSDAKTRAVLIDVSKVVHISPFRIYSTGYSFGGKTTYNMAWNNVHWFAAIVPLDADLCTSDDYFFEDCMYMQNVPTHIGHAVNDAFLSCGIAVYNAMYTAGNPVDSFHFPGGHDVDVPYRQDLSLVTDFFDQYTMHPYPKEVHHIVECTKWPRAFWVEAITSYNVVCGTDAVFRVFAQANNLIEIVQADTPITGFILYLNDHLVNMGQNVTVVYGTDTLYTGAASDTLAVTVRSGAQIRNPYRERLPLWEEVDSISRVVFGSSPDVPSGWGQPYPPSNGSQVEHAVLDGEMMRLHVYPNPFNPAVMISAGVRCIAPLRVMIYDISGRMVTDLTTRMSNGRATWDASSQPSGIYIVKARIGKQVLTKPVTLMK
ncbi:MAG: hypothetical protein A2487_00685 [Candidatus Raymondbacteria bacterium RifOxyC12_full_50_8]|uniref:Secretion system C-terminal sorting domain-containing protein n=1 Tax=Candidatus Raymondbacteria bacterium RIFOXYD12_FULL_49_13 TaxID=1817890 RepID=A0A1F7F9X6_UNCRA|nr:MAG: hypothetical protein A2350_03400 [Candidatus Raymondbacteria bacterium RifOxyB12_full_50_8]OGJ93244.1 MAG: hypothetical protein A2248_17905 [Candidatus Raymondbacteria bacterium RIFOXYA2_FULL_49_16]OGJ98150.1 MAG: hypothetical protein A2487_00685 [Candidatus Raymondbacteria bacterium RifOxyC12_full_50_8]OGK03327.1 MAG: hypothetical protein A2519_15250 [Candidatus Raymondbacteria bacterium RIFOXYD12_FULL_49_13]OGP44966.1 MAG: hypothetical protein A2324_19830 [Candidatus Raymondbacteria b